MPGFFYMIGGRRVDGSLDVHSDPLRLRPIATIYPNIFH